jgi:hypothetical protein
VCRIVAGLDNIRAVSAKIARLRAVATSPSAASSSGTLSNIAVAAAECAKVTRALVEIEQAVVKHRELEKKHVNADVLAALREHCAALSSLRDAFEATCASARSSGYTLVSDGE